MSRMRLADSAKRLVGHRFSAPEKGKLRAMYRWRRAPRSGYLRGASGPRGSPGEPPMIEIFKGAIERGASDIHIKAGDNIRARIHGKLSPVTQQKLTNDQVRALAMKLMP